MYGGGLLFYVSAPLLPCAVGWGAAQRTQRRRRPPARRGTAPWHGRLRKCSCPTRCVRACLLQRRHALRLRIVPLPAARPRRAATLTQPPPVTSTTRSETAAPAPQCVSTWRYLGSGRLLLTLPAQSRQLALQAHGISMCRSLSFSLSSWRS